MPARLLDGAAVAQAIRAETRPAIDAFTVRAGRPPGLGIVLVGAGAFLVLYSKEESETKKPTVVVKRV